MTGDITEIWSHPKGGTVPDLTPHLEARDLAEMYEFSDPQQDRTLAAMEAGQDRALNKARAVAADLKAKGINFDVDRMMRGSLLERALLWWDDLKYRRQTRDDPEDEPVPDDALFAFDLPAALTFPTNTLNAEYDAIDVEVARMVEGLSRQITVSRGRGPLNVSIPDDVLDELAEADDWTEGDDALIEVADIAAYWPAVGSAPALSLSVAHEDGGNVIEVKLLGHGPAAHRSFVTLLADHGGQLQ